MTKIVILRKHWLILAWKSQISEIWSQTPHKKPEPFRPTFFVCNSWPNGSNSSDPNNDNFLVCGNRPLECSSKFFTNSEIENLLKIVEKCGNARDCEAKSLVEKLVFEDFEEDEQRKKF